MKKAFRVLVSSDLEPMAVAGATVYECRGYDYGLADDDTRLTGKRHISVTLNSDGEFPSFTIPVENLEIIKE